MVLLPQGEQNQKVMSSIVYNKKFHVDGDLSRPLTKQGNDLLLKELLSSDATKRICIQTAEQMTEWRKDFAKFSQMTDDEKQSFVLCLKFWFKELKARMNRFKIQKENFALYGTSWNEITKFVFQF